MVTRLMMSRSNLEVPNKFEKALAMEDEYMQIFSCLGGV